MLASCGEGTSSGFDESKRVVELGASSVAGELDGRNVDQIRAEFVD